MALAVGLVLSAAAWAQRMPQVPKIPGEFKPVVGSGAQYDVTAKNQTVRWNYAVVGKENVEGAEGYWLEMRLEGAKEGSMIMKHLMVMHNDIPEIKRMIMQAAGQPPIEMPIGGMLGSMMRQSRQTGPQASSLGEKVGTEAVTVPAGTFVCEHYRTRVDKTTADVWVSTKVSPYGMVKMTSADMTMVLTKVLANETSQIKGEPQKFELPHF
jgi:hypothetical protein